MAKPQICTQCLSLGRPRTYTPASGWILFLFGLGTMFIGAVMGALVFFFVSPVFWIGLIFTVLAMCISKKECRVCKAPASFVPLDTPIGAELERRGAMLSLQARQPADYQQHAGYLPPGVYPTPSAYPPPGAYPQNAGYSPPVDPPVVYPQATGLPQPPASGGHAPDGGVSVRDSHRK